MRIPFKWAATWIILAALAIASVVCFLLEHTAFTDEGLARDLVHALGEAFAVAFFLGLGGDFYLKRKLGEESVKKGVQGALAETLGFLDSAQPQALRSAVQQLAGSNVYIRQAVWSLDFDWANDLHTVIKIHISRRVTGKSLARGGYRPKGHLWALGSVRDYETSYLEYVLSCPNADINVSEDQESLAPFLAKSDGKVRLSQENLLSNRLSIEQSIPFEESFTQNRSVCMYQAAVSWVPLMHTDFEMNYKIQLGGSALPSLSVSVFHPGHEMTDQDWVYLGGVSHVRLKEWQNITPGQATIISWLPKELLGIDFLTKTHS